MKTIHQDTERNYTGTNFVVISFVVLLTLVGVYFLAVNIHDVRDDAVMYNETMSVP